MFRAVGYHDETQRADPPEKIELWRGGTIPLAMSWSGTRSVAEKFRDRRNDGTEELWTATVGPERLLAHYDRVRSEDEYVIDPTGLKPTLIVTRERRLTIDDSPPDASEPATGCGWPPAAGSP
jgi:hypothetical protein